MSSEIFAVKLYFKTPLSIITNIEVKTPIQIGVEIKNISEHPVLITGVLDGSETKQRFPYYIPNVKGPALTQVVKEWTDFTSPLRTKNFRRLVPGQSFDPTGETPETNFFPLVAFQNFRPLAPGRYSFSLTFSTDSKNDEEWLGTLPDNEQISLLSMVAEVPHCTTQSNVLTIDIVKKSDR